MDQVRVALAWLKKHHFWVLLGLIALIAPACWWMNAKASSTKYDQNQKTIKGGHEDVDRVLKAPFHPNQNIIDKQNEEKKKQSESVLKVWQQLYDRQHAQVLQWPTALSKSFRDTVEKLDFNDDIPADLRNNYLNYIEQHFPELPKQINARVIEPNALGGAGGNFGGGRYGGGDQYGGAAAGAQAEEDNSICDWLDQNAVREELHFAEQPSSLRIWVTQEDLWVYHTLLDVIAKTNQEANATRRSNAAVKTVIALQVGTKAAPYSKQPNRLLKRPPAAAAVTGEGAAAAGDRGGARPGATMGAPGMGERGGGAGGMGGAIMSPAQEQTFLISGRYVDDKGPVVLGAAAAGDAAGGAPPPPSGPPAAGDSGPAPPLDMAQFGVGYKRLPVRMVLQMDSRWLPQLLTNCANEPLRVEVQEVRINPPDAGGTETSGFGGGGGRGGGGGAGSGARLFPDHVGIESFPAQPNVINVVIQGTIFIYKKPNATLLGAGEQKPAA